MWNRCAIALLLVAVLAAVDPIRAFASPPEGYIVVLKDDTADVPAVAADHARAHGVGLRYLYSHALKGYSAVIPLQRLAHVLGDPRVLFISVDQPMSAVAQSLPTGINRIEADVNLPGAVSGPAVAVIDTGSGPHPDLNIAGGFNCSTGKSYADGNGHGTHVAGTIGARNNSAGVVGVSPGVPIYSVRVLNNAGSGSWSSVACGIDWVTANAASAGVVRTTGTAGTATRTRSTKRSAAPWRRG
jgi:subtilisin